jgi:hypothetical protein
LAPLSITPQQMKALDSKATFEFLATSETWMMQLWGFGPCKEA